VSGHGTQRRRSHRSTAGAAPLSAAELAEVVEVIPPARQGEDTEYRVADLAREAGTSVRNVRVYQDRGLLPPPRRVGRIGLYSRAHLARLRLITRLLDRGYTFATIGELFESWSQGHDIADALGLRDAIAAPWSEETPVRMSQADLRRRLGRQIDPAALERAVELGLIRPAGSSFVVPSPRLLEAGAELAAAGVPMSTVLDLAAALRDDMATVAHRFFEVLLTTVSTAREESGEQAEAGLVDTITRLRPHAQRTVDALLAMAMQQEANRLVAERMGLPTPPPAPQTRA
jgi:DNA-binding transcriptional MerR regulator